LRGHARHCHRDDPPARSQDREETLRSPGSLNAEYGLARLPQFYFVLDVSEKTLELKVRGMALRSWPLRSMRFWGKPTFQGNVELETKSTLKAPERIVIRPEGNEGTGARDPAGDSGFEVEALELKDMPESFRLEFDNGFHVSVKSSKAARGGWLKTFLNEWKWHVGLPLKGFFGFGRDGSESWLELIFEEKADAQAIYWHFFEGIRGIVI
jgi:hypothetical protein